MSIFLSKKLKQARPNVYMHWCPACKCQHFFYTNGGNEGKPSWGFNGNLESPSFSPSMHIHYDEPTMDDSELDRLMKLRETDKSIVVPSVRITTCHYYLTAGKLIYMTDCPHELRGHTVDLPDYPKDTNQYNMYE